MKKAIALFLAIIILMSALALFSCDIFEAKACKHDDPQKLIIVLEGKEPTCTEEGLTSEIKCAACDTVISTQTVIPTVDCVAGDWIVDKEATEDEEGKQHTECIFCGKLLEERPLFWSVNITMWISNQKGLKEFTEEKIAEFKKIHPEYRFDVTLEFAGEDSAVNSILNNPAKTPDIYSLTQIQLSHLVSANVLAPLSNDAAQKISKENDAGSVAAATMGDEIYAYPMTSDNGYFLYYDSSVVSDEDAETIEGIIAACQRSGKKFGYNLTNAWYMAGFFFAQPVEGGEPLCTSTWTYSVGGGYPVSVDDTFNSQNGLIAMKAMKWLANSGAWVDECDNFRGTGAIVTGIWNADIAKGEYGDNMKAAKLPTFTVDGKTYQLGSFSGAYKLLGCKPQEDPLKAKLCEALALYLTSEEVQLDRYCEFSWGPSNLEAQKNEKVESNIVFSALFEQNIYAQNQGAIPDLWWDEAAKLAKKCQTKNLTDDDMSKALEEYEEKLAQILSYYNP